MKYTRLIGTVIAFCMAVPLFAQQYKATIPYRIVGEKMVIEMKVNGNARPFIFDTGGRTALTTKACEQRGKLLQNYANRKSDNSR